MVNLVVEDKGKTRALQRVTADREARRHYPRVVQGERGQWQALCSSGANDSLCQNLKCAGAISQRQVQNNLWERREEVGNKLPSPCPHHGDEVGQNPSGPQGFFASQSPRQKFKDKRPTVSSCMENQKPENAGRMGEKARETGSPNLAKSQISDTTGDEEEGDQKKRPTQNQGHRKENISREGANGKERRTRMEAGGRQIVKNERSHPDSDRDQNNGMITSDAQISVDSKLEEDEGDSSGGEKNRSSSPFPAGEFNSDLGREIKAGRGPKAREERSLASKSEDEGVEISQVEKRGQLDAERLGMVARTWPMVETKAKRFFQTTQGEEVIGLGKLSITDCWSSAGESSDPEVDRAQGMELDLGRPIQMGPGPKPGMSSLLMTWATAGIPAAEQRRRRLGCVRRCS